MPLEQLLTDRVQIVRRRQTTTEDEYGAPVTTSEEYVDTVWARVVQTQATEVTVGDARVLSDWTATFPPGTVLDHTDRIRHVAGVEFEVVGVPARPRDAQRRESRVKAQLRYLGGR